MNSIHVKSCPKCGGDLYSQSDMFGPYVSSNRRHWNRSLLSR